MKPRYIVGGVIIVIFLVWALLSFNQSRIEYTDIQTAKSNGKTVQIIATWIKDMDNSYDSKNNIFTFYVRDKKNAIAKVIFQGSKPNNFELAPNIVLKGKYVKDSFIADEILTKCPSKYESQIEE